MKTDGMTLTQVATGHFLWLLEHRARRPEWPYWEAHTLAVARHLIRPGSVVWDIGAEEGDFPALWGSWGAEVVLVEPNPKVWPQIRLHWEANVDREPLACLVGLASDRTLPAEADYPTGFRGVWPEVAYGEVMPDHGFRHIWEHAGVSPQFRLDDWWMGENLPDPDLVVMDIEGGEWPALRGAEAVLDGARPDLLVSIHPEFLSDLYGADSDDVVRYVTDRGYEARRICIDHEEHFWFRPL